MRQLGCSGGNIRQHHHMTVLRLDPVHLSLQHLRQALVQLRKGVQRRQLIDTESIGLKHAHIPANRASGHRHVAQHKSQKQFIHSGTDHQMPLGMKLMQLDEHRSLTGGMAVAMTAHADVDQHGACSLIARRCRVCS